MKAQNDYHEKVLRKIGADQVVHPERDMGIRIANNILSNNVLDYLELSDEHSIMEIRVNEKIASKSLIDLDIRARYGINIVAVKRGNNIIVSPQADEKLIFNDVLIIIGADVDIIRFEKKVLNNFVMLIIDEKTIDHEGISFVIYLHFHNDWKNHWSYVLFFHIEMVQVSVISFLISDQCVVLRSHYFSVNACNQHLLCLINQIVPDSLI